MKTITIGFEKNKYPEETETLISEIKEHFNVIEDDERSYLRFITINAKHITFISSPIMIQLIDNNVGKTISFHKHLAFNVSIDL